MSGTSTTAAWSKLSLLLSLAEGRPRERVVPPDSFPKFGIVSLRKSVDLRSPYWRIGRILRPRG
jgi:hypothetical protein